LAESRFNAEHVHLQKFCPAAKDGSELVKVMRAMKVYFGMPVACAIPVKGLCAATMAYAFYSSIAVGSSPWQRQ
jgi:hypothetical protein